MQRIVVSLTLALAGVVIAGALTSCTSDTRSSTDVAVCMPDYSQAAVLEELEQMPVPPGADPIDFEEVRGAFREMILSGNVKLMAKGASAGLGTAVNDLVATDMGGGTWSLTWTYRHQGDYDQNGEVNVSDISPVGLYFNTSNLSLNWSTARVADGDGNGEVNVSDLTAIGQNFGSSVSGYSIESSPTPGDANSWTEVTNVDFSTGTRPPGQTFRSFAAQLSGQSSGMSYRVVPLLGTGGGSGGEYDEIEPNDDISSPNQISSAGVTALRGSLGNGAGYAGYDGDSDDLFRFSAADGQHLEITLNFNGGTADLDLYLLNSSGETLLSSIGTGSVEQISANVTSGGTFLVAASCFSGYSDYTLSVQITGGGGGFVEPPTETFIDYSQPGDTAERKWLLNCYRELPPWQDADRCFQNAAITGWANQVLQITNQHRQDAGLPALVFDPHLELVAQAHSRDMALRQYFAHENLYGMTHGMRLDAVQRPPYTPGDAINGENIYAGRLTTPENTPVEAMEWWMNSPGHRSNILNPNVTHLGIGVYYHTGDPSGYYVYFTQVFANWAVDPNAHNWLDPNEVPGP